MVEVRDWQSCYRQVDDSIVCITTDMGAAADLEELQAHNLLRVQYVLSAPDADGLPQGEEEALLARLRQELNGWINVLGGRLVAEVSGGGQHSWFSYVPCGWLEAANLVHRIGLRQHVTLGAEMQADASHRIYHDHLMPTPEELRRTQLAERLTEMAAQGDDAGCPRPVVHEVRFDNRVQALACADWARHHGFSVEGPLPPRDGQAGYRLFLKRVMQPEAAALDADMAAITEAVQRLGGDYMDWQVELRLPQTA